MNSKIVSTESRTKSFLVLNRISIFFRILYSSGLPAFFLGLGIFLVSDTISAQQFRIDSLNRVIRETKQDTTIAIAYMEIADILYESHPDTLVPLCNKVLFLIEKDLPGAGKKERHSFLLSKADALTNLAVIFQLRGQLDKALDYNREVLSIQEEMKAPERMGTTLNNMAVIYYKQGQIKPALEYYSRSLKLRQQAGDIPGAAQSLSNMGVCYMTQGQTEKALENFQQSLQLREKSGDKRGAAYSMNNIGGIYDKMGKLTEALDYYSRSREIYEKLDAKNGIANEVHNIGGIYEKQGMREKALSAYKKGLSIYHSIGDKQGVANSLLSIGQTYLRTFEDGKKDRVILDSANKCLDSALHTAQRGGFAEAIRNAYMLRARADSAGNNPMGAFENFKQYIFFRDSITNQATRKAGIQKQFQYEFDKKEALLKSEHEKERAIDAEKSRKQKIVIWSSITVLALVVLFAAFVFRTLGLTRRQKRIIEEKSAVVEEKQKEILDSITYAKRLQEAILPPVQSIKQEFPESFLFYRPKDIVAGDFYWMDTQASPDITFLAVADCTGHGVPGAMISVVCSNALNRAVKEFRLCDTGLILDKVTDLVLETFENSGSEVRDGMDISLLAYNKVSRTLQWSGANNPLWYFEKEALLKISPDKQPVGKHEHRHPFTTHKIKHSESQVFYLFTDGLPDQFGGPKGKKFMYKRFEELLCDLRSVPLDKQEEHLRSSFLNWKNSLEQVDDVTVVGIRI